MLPSVIVGTLWRRIKQIHICIPMNLCLCFKFQEKVGCGLFIAMCVLATPAWITTHMDDYRGGPVGQA